MGRKEICETPLDRHPGPSPPSDRHRLANSSALTFFSPETPPAQAPQGKAATRCAGSRWDRRTAVESPEHRSPPTSTPIPRAPTDQAPLGRAPSCFILPPPPGQAEESAQPPTRCPAVRTVGSLQGRACLSFPTRKTERPTGQPSLSLSPPPPVCYLLPNAGVGSAVAAPERTPFP